MSRALMLLAGLASASALYGPKDDVIHITSEADFDKTVVKGAGVYMVEFYAPWCGHCKNLVPAWKEAGKALKGIVGVVAVDATAAQGLASRYGVQGFPTIKFFGADKSKPAEYQGGRDGPSIVSYAMSQAQAVVKARMGGKAGKDSGSGSGSKGSGSKPKASGNGDASQPGGGKGVVTLGSDNFEDQVYGSSSPWLVEFYAPWCGHCKNLAPEWAEAAEQTAGEAKFGAVDATVHAELAQQFNVKGYPTIMMFPAGAKGPKDARPYNGGRSASDLVSIAQSLAAEGGGAPAGVAQLTSSTQFTDLCTGGKKLCVLAVLPHILDDGADKRNARLATLTEAAAKGKGKPMRILWSQVGDQPALEAALNIGLVPAVVALAVDKKVYTVHKGAFTPEALSTFATSLTTNKGAAGALPFPASFEAGKAVVSATAWDGKNAAAPVEDEIPLDQLDL